MRKKKLIDKKVTKLASDGCYFCDEKDKDTLEVHRILEGHLGGEYTNFNSLITCSNCHSRIHKNQIKIDRKYYSTKGVWVLHYWINGVEYWK